MSSPLFRAEVDPHQSADAPTPHLEGASVSAFLLAAIVSIIALCAALVPFADIETGSATVVSEGDIELRSGAGGIVTRTFAKEGQTVKAGAPLAIIRQTEATSLGERSTLVEKSLTARANLLDEQRGIQDADALLNAEALRARGGVIASQLASLDRQAAQQQRLVELARARFEALGPLRQQGFVSEIEYRNREEAWIAAQQGLESLNSERARLAGEQGATAFEIYRVDLQRRGRSGDLAASQETVTQERALNASASERILLAPRDGIVSNLQIHEGSAIAVDQLVGRLLHPEARVLLEAYVSAKARPRIRSGMLVKVRYEAFPVGDYSAGDGIVETVSPVASHDDEGAGSGRLYGRYRLTVRITRLPLSPERLSVSPPVGSSATIAVQTSSRSLFDRLLAPLMSFLSTYVGSWRT